MTSTMALLFMAAVAVVATFVGTKSAAAWRKVVHEPSRGNETMAHGVRYEHVVTFRFRNGLKWLIIGWGVGVISAIDWFDLSY